MCPSMVLVCGGRVGEVPVAPRGFLKLMVTSVSPGSNASPEDSGEDNNIAVSTL